MGIFAKQGPYQEFKDLFVKEFDADKTVDRLNKVEADMNVGKEAIKRFEALNRETGKVDKVMSKYQQGLNTVANDPNASIWSKANAIKQLGTSYANDPERLAVATSKQNAVEMAKENAAKADTQLAIKKEELDLDFMGGSGVDAQGNIRTFRKQTVPKDTDPNAIINLIGSGFEKQGVSYEKDPVSGVEGYWQTEGKSRVYRRPEDIREVAKATLKADEDTRKHYELVSFSKLHDDYTTLYKQQGLPQLEAERMATGKLYEEQKDASGNPIKGSSILDKAVDNQLNTVAEAAVTKFRTEVTDRKLNFFQEAKGEGAGTGPTNLPLNTTTIPLEQTTTEGVSVLDPEGAITEENYNEYNKSISKLNKMKTELSKNVHVKSLIPTIEKIHSLPEKQQSIAYAKATEGLFSKIVGKVPADMSKLTEAQKKIYDGKIKTYTEALSNLYNYYNSSEESSSYIKAINETKHVLSTNYGVDKKHMPTTLDGMQKMIKKINNNKKSIVQELEVPSAEANDNLLQSYNQTLNETSQAVSAIGGINESISSALKKGKYKSTDNSTSIEDINTLKKAMNDPKENIKIAGFSMVKNKNLTASEPKIILNINGKNLYLNPTIDIIRAMEPFGVLDINQHRADLAKNSKPVKITTPDGTPDGKSMNVKIKWYNAEPLLYNVDANGGKGEYVQNGAAILKAARDFALKAHSTFTAETIADSETAKYEPSVGTSK